MRTSAARMTWVAAWVGTCHVNAFAKSSTPASEVPNREFDGPAGNVDPGVDQGNEMEQRRDGGKFERAGEVPEVVSNKHTARWRVYTDTGKELFSQGRLDDAEKYFVGALKEAKLGFGERDVHVASSCNNLAELYRMKRDFARAEPLYLEGVERLKNCLGEESASVGHALHNLAGFYLLQGKRGAAKELYLRSLQIKASALGVSHPDYANTLFHLSHIFRMENDLEKAVELLEKSIAVLDNAGLSFSTLSIRRQSLLSELHLNLRRFDEAEKLQRRTIHALQMSQGGENAPGLLSARENLCEIILTREERKRESWAGRGGGEEVGSVESREKKGTNRREKLREVERTLRVCYEKRGQRKAEPQLARTTYLLAFALLLLHNEENEREEREREREAGRGVRKSLQENPEIETPRKYEIENPLVEARDLCRRALSAYKNAWLELSARQPRVETSESSDGSINSSGQVPVLRGGLKRLKNISSSPTEAAAVFHGLSKSVRLLARLVELDLLQKKETDWEKEREGQNDTTLDSVFEDLVFLEWWLRDSEREVPFPLSAALSPSRADLELKRKEVIRSTCKAVQLLEKSIQQPLPLGSSKTGAEKYKPSSALQNWCKICALIS